MKIEVILAGEKLGVYSLDDMTLGDAFLLKAGTGLSPMQVERGIPEGDPDALRAVVWMLRRRTNPGLALESIDFRYGDFDFDVVPEVPADPPAQAVADPTSTTADAPTLT